MHALRRIYEDPDNEAVLLVDAENAFNSLNRRAALNNLQYTCPEFFKYILNTYRAPADLYVSNSDETIVSEEGTTQGDTSAMGVYACSLMPLLRKVKENCSTECPKQVWYADDAASGGRLKQIKKWWDYLQKIGPMYGYHPKPSKTWLIVKQEHIKMAEALFPDVKITTSGHRYLGSFIGDTNGLSEFIEEEMISWKEDISGLANIAQAEPQLAYSAFVYGTSKRWTYIARTTPGIADLLKPLEYQIKEEFIPSVIGKLYVPDNIRELIGLPSRMGGLNITDPTLTAELEYSNSVKSTQALAEAIFNQQEQYLEDQMTQSNIMKSIKSIKEQFYCTEHSRVVEAFPPQMKRHIELISEKGASSWLTSLPLQEYGFVLNRQEFHDAISLRYNLTLSTLNRSGICACGEPNTINHCLTCKLGGYVILRHNTIRDITAELLQMVCKDVEIEPPLMPVPNNYHLPTGTNTKEEARLDVSARGMWSNLDRALVDIRVLHPQAPSNSNCSIKQMYHSHEHSKKYEYNARVIQIEKATFTPLVFATTGGMGNEATRFMKRLAEKISIKKDQRYCDVIAFIRRRLRFDLLRTCLISIRGFRGVMKWKPSSIESLDVNLRPQAIY